MLCRCFASIFEILLKLRPFWKATKKMRAECNCFIPWTFPWYGMHLFLRSWNHSFFNSFHSIIFFFHLLHTYTHTPPTCTHTWHYGYYHTVDEDVSEMWKWWWYDSEMWKKTKFIERIMIIKYWVRNACFKSFVHKISKKYAMKFGELLG